MIAQPVVMAAPVMAAQPVVMAAPVLAAAGGGEGGDEKDQDGAGGVADAIVQATTEFELLRAFDAILAQPLPVTPEAAASFAAMMPAASQKRAELGEGVWTAKVATAYGHMLREMKRRREAREAEEGGGA